VSAASAATRGTASFFLSLFIMTYAMVFFLRDEMNVFARLLRYSGLSSDAQKQLSETTISVSRATLRGTFLIGLIQGILGGLGFLVAGIKGAAFWGILMAIASVIPGVGPALVWVPGVIYLAASGSVPAAIGLALWSGLVVSTIDNLLRPRLVGRDTAMPDILVLISTLGGLAMFGAVGLIIGPVIAGLFIAIWHLFVSEFGIDPDAVAKS
jgi:predicted PurR-regulated permease PerM